MRLKSGLMMVALACAAPALAAAPTPSTALSETFISYNPAGGSVRCPGRQSCSPTGTPKTWVAPISGIYTLTLAGGEGGGFPTYNQYYSEVEHSQYLDPFRGGQGAVVSGNYRIAAGTKLVIIPGQAGAQSSQLVPDAGPYLIAQGGGGGGGSFVFTVPEFVAFGTPNNTGTGYDVSQGTLLAAAGGGGGAGPNYYNSVANPGLASRNGGNSQYLDQEGAINLGGIDGGAGKDQNNFQLRTLGYYRYETYFDYVAGKPYEIGYFVVTGYEYTYGQDGGSAGASFREAAGGLTGGNSAAGFFNGSGVDLRRAPRNVNGLNTGVFNLLGYGGYGGGGGGGWYAPGAFDNVGYTGGGGGGGYSGGAGGYTDSNGGGGGSYIADDATWLYGLDGANAGNGWVSINFQAAVPEPSNWAMLIAGFGLAGASMRRRRWVTAA